VIFPEHCKFVGYASAKPLGDEVYFLSRYLIHKVSGGYEVLAVEPREGKGLMRPVRSMQTLAQSDEISIYPDRVNLHNRGDLIHRALETGKRCTIFTGFDEHMTFVLDPDPAVITTLHVYDLAPPWPHLSETLKSLDATGIFGDLRVIFRHHVHDISDTGADIYPCRAAGFSHTLDCDRPGGGERVAGCLTAQQLLNECYGEKEFTIIDICPANAAREEPFIARCCRTERTGTGRVNGKFGGIVHWGSSPREISDMVIAIMKEWEEQS
jgi:hypothetical protein